MTKRHRFAFWTGLAHPMMLLVLGCGAQPVPPALQTGHAGPEDNAITAAAAGETERAEAPGPARKGRVIILGFDGVDPGVVGAMLEKGELPNLDKLRKQGTFRPLRSSIPPQSPSAWSSFATCKSTGQHGIYDFMVREPRTYLPQKGGGSAKHAVLNSDGTVRQLARFDSPRKGEAFWKVADANGARTKVLNVPFAFPPDELARGRMLSGLGVTDIRNTDSTYFSFSEEYEKRESVSGGILFPLAFAGDTATVTIPGARNPLVSDSTKPGAYVEATLEFKVDRTARRLRIALPSESLDLAEGEWSKWVEWTFPVSERFSVRAISRFYAISAGETVKVYMTCLQFHPKEPYIRFSTPPDYSGELADRYGLYKTIGWTYDTHALRRDAITEDVFLDDVDKTMAWHERLMMDELNMGEFDLLITAWTGPDRVSHMFWRFRDPKHPLYTAEGAAKYGRAVETTYLKMDAIVGEAMSKLQPDDLLIVMSDHGFKSFRKGFNVNTWLIRNGYLAVEGQTDPNTAMTKSDFLQGFDWPRTKAYSLGLGSIFLNLRGREGQGTVDPAQAGALIDEIRSKLLSVTDPDTGDKVFNAVYTRDVFKGVSERMAPDLQLGYADGYQSSKATVVGAAPAHLFEPVIDKWSGEHASSDVETTPGIFFCNRAIAVDDPAIIDLGVTALRYIGVTPPADFEGRPLLPS